MSSDANLVPSIDPNDPNLRFASFQHRLGAYALDAGLLLLTCWIGWQIWSVVIWGEGQTPGKKILGIRVYAADTGKRVTWGHMAIREFLFVLAIGIAASLMNLVSFGILGTIAIIAWYVLEIVWYFTKGSRSMRDFLVKTIVINEAK